MPEGPLGFPRFTTLGPFVKEDCFNRVCLGGASKKEFAESLVRAFGVYSQTIDTTLNSYGVPVEKAAIAGSIAEGNYGLRSSEKVKEYLIGDAVFDMAGITAEEVEQIINNAEDQCEVYDMFVQKYSDEHRVHQTVRARVCSDIDMVAFVDLDEQEAHRLEDEIFGEVIHEVIGPTEREMVGHIAVESLIWPVEDFEEQMLTTKEEIREAMI